MQEKPINHSWRQSAPLSPCSPFPMVTSFSRSGFASPFGQSKHPRMLVNQLESNQRTRQARPMPQIARTNGERPWRWTAHTSERPMLEVGTNNSESIETTMRSIIERQCIDPEIVSSLDPDRPSWLRSLPEKYCSLRSPRAWTVRSSVYQSWSMLSRGPLPRLQRGERNWWDALPCDSSGTWWNQWGVPTFVWQLGDMREDKSLGNRRFCPQSMDRMATNWNSTIPVWRLKRCRENVWFCEIQDEPLGVLRLGIGDAPFPLTLRRWSKCRPQTTPGLGTICVWESRGPPWRRTWEPCERAPQCAHILLRMTATTAWLCVVWCVRKKYEAKIRKIALLVLIE